MNLLRKIYGLCTAMLCLVLIAGCSDDDVISSNGTAGYLKLMVCSTNFDCDTRRRTKSLQC